MNLKRTVLSLMAAGTILLGGAAGVSAQTASSTVGGHVTVNTTGTFSAQFCDADIAFTNVTLNSTNPTGASTSSINICYTDTQAYRGVFRTFMAVDNFTDGSGHSIAATNVKPSYIYNVAQGQWNVVPGIGGIGGMKGAASYGAGANGYVNNAASAGPWLGGDLSGWQYVGYAFDGVGTAGTQYLPYNGGVPIPALDNGSVAKIDLRMTVPSTTVNGYYYSTFYLQVNPQTP